MSSEPNTKIFWGDQEIALTSLDVAFHERGLQDNIKKENPMDTKTKKKLFLMDEDERFLYEKGYIDIDGDLTSQGRQEFIQYLFDSESIMRDGWTKYMKALENPEEADDAGC